MPTSLIAPIVGAGASFGLSKLFGGSQSNPGDAISGFSPTGINAGGLTSGMNGGNLTITPSSQRLGLVGDVANQFGAQADILAGLRSQVVPGENAFLKSRLDELNSSKLNAVGNLRENLQRRRVLGSSFAQDAFTRTNAEFSKQADAIQADSFLKSIDETQKLAQMEFTARRGQFQTGLDELNLEASTAATLAGKATDVLARGAQLQAELQAKSNAGAGAFFGNNVIQPISKAIGGANFSNFFSGGGGGFSFDPVAG